MTTNETLTDGGAPESPKALQNHVSRRLEGWKVGARNRQAEALGSFQ